MKFEVINDKSKPVMTCTQESCVPPADMLKSMSAAGYKFRLDGKVVSVKKIMEVRKMSEK